MRSAVVLCLVGAALAVSETVSGEGYRRKRDEGQWLRKR